MHLQPSWSEPPAADPAQDLRAVRDEIAELKRRIEVLEVRVAAVYASGDL